MRRSHSGGRTQVDLPIREGASRFTKGAVGHPEDGREFVDYLDCALVGGAGGCLLGCRQGHSGMASDYRVGLGRPALGQELPSGVRSERAHA